MLQLIYPVFVMVAIDQQQQNSFMLLKEKAGLITQYAPLSVGTCIAVILSLQYTL